MAAQKKDESKQGGFSRNPSVPVREAASTYAKKQQVQVEPEPPKAASILAPLPAKPAITAAANKKAKKRAADSSDENESSDDSDDVKKSIRAPPPKIGGAMPLPSLGGAATTTAAPTKPLPSLVSKPAAKKNAFADSDEDDASDWKPTAKIQPTKAPAQAAKKPMAFFDDESD